MSTLDPNTPSPIDPIKLDKLAEVAVKVRAAARARAGPVSHRAVDGSALVRRIAEHAYRAGAGLVTPLLSDDEITLARYRFGPDASFDRAAAWLYDGVAKALGANTARLAVAGDNPMLLSGQDPAKVARANKANSLAYQPALEKIAGFDINWTIVAYPGVSWARQVFPDVEEDEAVARLADAIFAASRVDHDDPVAAWADHNAALRRRTDWLNAQRFHALHYAGPGTDLTIGLADGHEWQGGASAAKNGIVCNPNIPTEEVFTTPHARRVAGHVASTKPLSYQGTLIDGIAVRFEGGADRRRASRARRGGAEQSPRQRRGRTPPRRGRARAPFVADLEERAAVLQHAVRRECRLPHRARAMLFEVFPRRRDADARRDRGAGGQQEPDPYRLDDRLGPHRHRRPAGRRPAGPRVPQRRVDRLTRDRGSALCPPLVRFSDPCQRGVAVRRLPRTL